MGRPSTVIACIETGLARVSAPPACYIALYHCVSKYKELFGIHMNTQVVLIFTGSVVL